MIFFFLRKVWKNLAVTAELSIKSNKVITVEEQRAPEKLLPS
jgi:hypothetical protein